jgi:hypothetical protein
MTGGERPSRSPPIRTLDGRLAAIPPRKSILDADARVLTVLVPAAGSTVV